MIYRCECGQEWPAFIHSNEQANAAHAECLRCGKKGVITSVAISIKFFCKEKYEPNKFTMLRAVAKTTGSIAGEFKVLHKEKIPSGNRTVIILTGVCDKELPCTFITSYGSKKLDRLQQVIGSEIEIVSENLAYINPENVPTIFDCAGDTNGSETEVKPD